MKRAGVLALVGLALAVPQVLPAARARAAAATIQLAQRHPLVIRGTHFRDRERVRIVLTATSTTRAQVVADSRGSFTARFDRVLVGRCSRLSVLAVGSSGSRATLRLLPAPACLPA